MSRIRLPEPKTRPARGWLWLLMVLSLGAARLRASEFSSRPLEQVLDAETQVVEGVVRAVSRADSAGAAWLRVELDGARSWPHGRPAPECWSFRFPLPEIRDSCGVRVGSFSPLSDSSGLEFLLKPGERWLLLAHPAPGQACPSFFRAEPDRRRTHLKALWKQARRQA